MLGDGNCHSSMGLVILKLGLQASLILKERTHCVWTWMLGHWTCHSSIGLVTLKLGLRPSFILNEKLLLFLDLDAAWPGNVFDPRLLRGQVTYLKGLIKSAANAAFLNYIKN